MNTLQRHSRRSVIAAVLVLAALMAIGSVGWPGREPSRAVLAAGPGSIVAAAAVDMFLKIEGVDGESTNAAHKNWIEIQSWSWGVSQLSSGGGGGGGLATGRLTGHVTLIKRIDKSSPLLFKRCSDGTVMPLVTVELARLGGGPTYLKYELKEVLISSIAHGDVDGDGAPDETITLDFTSTKLTYTQYDASGKPVGQVSAEGASVPVIR